MLGSGLVGSSDVALTREASWTSNSFDEETSFRTENGGYSQPMMKGAKISGDAECSSVDQRPPLVISLANEQAAVVLEVVLEWRVVASGTPAAYRHPSAVGPEELFSVAHLRGRWMWRPHRQIPCASPRPNGAASARRSV